MSKQSVPRASRLVVLFVITALLLSLAPAPLAAEGDSAPARQRTLSEFGRQPQPVPEELRALFAGGMSADEFVSLTGRVPRALEPFVEQDVLVIIELHDRPMAALYAERRAQGGAAAMADLQAYSAALTDAQGAVIASAGLSADQVISQYTTVYNGIQARVPASRIAEIAALPGVKAVHRAPIHEPALGSSTELIGAPSVWQDLGLDGQGVIIAVIDTGIDYNHGALGGSGNPADYAGNDPAIVEEGTFPTAKVIDGWDFAGTLYNADCSADDEAAGLCSATPAPDADPLDENGHGTHVSSIAAGVMAGDVMTGTAPMAQLVALKVFGADGTTSLTVDALEWATQKYIAEGWPHVINMSLGSPFGTEDPEDPDVEAANNAVDAGIIVVASAGNSGDTTYITGSPGVADKVLSVAATTTGYATGPTVSVSDTVYITQTGIVYTPGSFDDGTGHFTETITAPLGYVGNLPGAADDQLCSTDGIAADALTGQVALISRGGCDFSLKVNNAASLGAVAALIYNNQAGIISMIGAPVSIPGASLQQQQGLNLIPADGETVIITAEDEVITVPDPYTPADSIATFSSRGPRGYDSALKPEVSAPGVGIFAADMGSGSGGVSMGGTSMAAPHVAGVAAMVRQAHPDWSPEEIKAAIMNTSVPLADYTPLPLAGNGRVDAYAATTTEVLAIGDDDLVSLNWGVVSSKDEIITLTGQVALYNKGASSVEYDADIMLQNGSATAGVLALEVGAGPHAVAAGASASVPVTVVLDMSSVDWDYYQHEEYFGQVTLSPSIVVRNGASPQVLTVPFYFVPKPYAKVDIVSDTNIVHPATDAATITTTLTGPVPSSLWGYPALYASDAPNPAVHEMASVRMFGMDYGWADAEEGDVVALAINSWGPWHVPQPFFAEFDLYLDVDGDAVFDWVNFNFNYGWFSGTDDSNEWIIVQVDLATGYIYLGSPWLIYTDYNNAVMEWYLPAEWQGLVGGDTLFDYLLVSWDPYGVAEVSAEGSYDYMEWPYIWWWTGSPTPAAPEQTFTVMVGDRSAYDLAAPLGFMIVDFSGDPQNDDGAQAYLAPINPFWTQLRLPIARDGD